MKAHYIFTTNTEKAKINKIIKDKLTEFSTWIDDNEELLMKSDYGVQFCYISLSFKLLSFISEVICDRRTSETYEGGVF